MKNVLVHKGTEVISSKGLYHICFSLEHNQQFGSLTVREDIIC